ncbi:hypothetical protein CTZ27_16180 [Streptomyces griseocarneus]|nr:hypothetical protein CTZ27_16180 [Streptomyces griseocarneus]
MGRGETATVYRARSARTPPPLRAPTARLTGLGSGLLTTVVMLAVGSLSSLVGAPPTVYGFFFLLASAACALWVRTADLVTAPVTAPIAFAVGAVPLSDGPDTFGGHVMGLVTVLSLHAGWLYSGTLLAALIALVRRMAVIRQRRLERVRQRRRPSRPPRSPRCSAAERARSPR